MKRGGGKNQHVGDKPGVLAERILEALLNDRRWKDVAHAFRQNHTVTVQLDELGTFDVVIREVRTPTAEVPT